MAGDEMGVSVDDSASSTENVNPLKALLVRYEVQLARVSPLIQAVLDIIAWTVGITLALYIRLDFNPLPIEREGLRKFLVIAAVVQLVVGLAVGLYRARWRYGSFDEVKGLVATVLITTVLLYVIDRALFLPYLVPLSAVLVGGFVGLVSMAGARYAWRLVVEWRKRPTEEGAERVLIYGAGDPGIQVVTSMLRTPSSPFIPVGIIDDNPAKRRLTVMGVRVLGGMSDLEAAMTRTGASVLLISDPAIGGDLVTALTDLAIELGMSVKVIPPVGELLGASPGVEHIRDISEADLLGRHEIETDLAAIAGYLTGKRVLVTGAGGSIGSELCRQLSRFAPEELMMLDRDESGLHGVQLSIEGRALLNDPSVILVDIRDADALLKVFRERKPQVVFHAAALKHLPLLERYPDEALKSNVIGSLNVLRAAQAVGVEKFVNVSTDKAASPTSVLGYSKRLAERLTASVAQETESGVYLSVRFGNVLGSRGSVLTTFYAQIAAGGPITVTDPEVTRYFMTIPEAVQLVIQAGAIGDDGEVLVLDMGSPVKIVDVARRLASQSPRPIQIVFTGLRPGEKLHEELFGADELDARPKHPLISHTSVPPLDPTEVIGHENTVDLVGWMSANS
ncbi:MAG: nucleoside-diphosphate sugar epimerase/dehydratase [Microthrixaceae bacterium]